MATAEQNKGRFIATHLRQRDRLPAMLLGLTEDGGVLYRVQWSDNGRRLENTLVRPVATFAETYSVTA